MIASLGLSGPGELHPAMLMRRIDHVHTASYFELYDWLAPARTARRPPRRLGRRLGRRQTPTASAARHGGRVE